MRNFILIAFFLLMTVAPAFAANQIFFKTPGQATEALIGAVRERNTQKIIMILGHDAQDIMSSGDPVADRNERRAFLEAYDTASEIELADDGERAILTIGTDNWPFAIPLLREDRGWRFDMAEGKRELLYRRVGRNELAAIEVCRAYVDAQEDYAALLREQGQTPAYAQKITSSKGKKDGLYWPASAKEPQSPLGELAAKAAAEGYKKKRGHQPYHGYYYKILDRQGTAADGGALSYIVHGRMIGGFALIAWPAEYGDSGIMSFIVNQDGVVYQKDLGAETASIASKTDTFNPDDGWVMISQDAGV